MHFYNKEGDSVRQIKNCERNYECFGWWFPDLLIHDVIKPQTTSEHLLTDDKFDIDADLKAKKLASEESLTSGSQLDKTEPNPNVEGLEDKFNVRQTRANEGKFKNKIMNSPNVDRLEDTFNIRQTQAKEGKFKNKIMTPIAPLTVARSSIRNRRIKTSLKNKGSIAESSPTRQQLATLINRDSSNHQQLAAVLNSVSRNETQLQILEKDFKTSTSVITNEKQILPKTMSQNVHSDSGIDDGTPDQNGLSLFGQFVELALSIEHDSDHELEEPRDQFLQVASGLSSKLRALEADTKQLHLDVITLQQDFQMQAKTVTKMTQEARQLGADIQDLRYLDDLIFLLQGQLDRITLRNWPFLLAHIVPQTDNSQELNLVV